MLRRTRPLRLRDAKPFGLQIALKGLGGDVAMGQRRVTARPHPFVRQALLEQLAGAVLAVAKLRAAVLAHMVRPARHRPKLAPLFAVRHIQLVARTGP